MDPSTSRTTWRALEPVHAMVYFAPEAQEEYAALGFDVKGNPAYGYFPARAAALGAVGAGVVQATFFNFSPIACVFGMDRAWETASPAQLVEARWWETLLHTHRERRLRAALLRHGGPDVAVVTVPWQLAPAEPEQVIAAEEPAAV